MRKSVLVYVLLLAFGAKAQQTTGLFQYEAETEEGFILWTPLLNGHNQYLMNNCGQIVHTWHTPNTTPANSIYLMENGDLLYPAKADTAVNSPMPGGGGGERILRTDWDANVLWDFVYYDANVRLHHDIEPMENGNVLAIAWVLMDSLDCIAAGRNPSLIQRTNLWSERIIEIEPTGPTTGNIVWQWDLWDHLVQDFDPTKDNYGVPSEHPELLDINWVNTYTAVPGIDDFVHLNAIDYNEELDQIVLSSQVHSEIWIVDHSTSASEASGHSGGTYGKGGDFLYRWGNPQVYGRGSAADQKLWRQHDSNWIPDGFSNAGEIMIFNNGLDRTPNFSEIDVITPPQTTLGVYEIGFGQAYGPQTKSWNYHAEDSVSFYSFFISGARRLPSGNTLVCSGRNGHLFEVTHNGEVVWSYVNPEGQWGILSSTDQIPMAGGGQFPTNVVFRAEKYPVDYAGFDGYDLSTGVQLEANPIISSCVVGYEDFANEDFSVYPNPTSGIVNLENLSGAIANVFSVDGRLIVSRSITSDNEILDLSGHPSGLYILTLDLKGDRLSRKLIVE